MGRAEDFLASITPLVPIDEPDDDGTEGETPDEMALILAAIHNLALPAPIVNLPAPRIAVGAPDLGPLLAALERASLDPAMLGDAIGVAVATALAQQPDTVGALELVVAELALLRKKLNGVTGGGGGGGATEVSLRAGADRMPVSDTNPLPVALVTDEGTWGYAAGTNGVVALPGTAKVKQITATALGAQGTFTINGGNTILLPYDSTDKVSSSIDMPIRGVLLAPNIVFDAAVDAFLVQYLA